MLLHGHVIIPAAAAVDAADCVRLYKADGAHGVAATIKDDEALILHGNLFPLPR